MVGVLLGLRDSADLALMALQLADQLLCLPLMNQEALVLGAGEDELFVVGEDQGHDAVGVVSDRVDLLFLVQVPVHDFEVQTGRD